MIIMLDLSYKEKLELMGSLNWDYLDRHEDMLAVIEGRLITDIGILMILIFSEMWSHKKGRSC